MHQLVSQENWVITVIFSSVQSFALQKKCVTAVALSVFMLRLVMSLSAIAYPDRPQLSEKLNTRYKRMACLNTV